MDCNSSVELLSIYSWFSDGLYGYVVEHLWAFFCCVIQGLKISVCFADLIMQVYTITVLVLTQISITFQLSCIMGTNVLNCTLYTKSTVLFLRKLDGPQSPLCGIVLDFSNLMLMHSW